MREIYYVNKSKMNDYGTTSADKNLITTSNVSDGALYAKNVAGRRVLFIADDTIFEDIGN
jgi:hypothetical protein